MKTLILLAVALTSLLSFQTISKEFDYNKAQFYIKNSLGYKLGQAEVVRDYSGNTGYSHPIAYTGEIGIQYKELSFGWKHDSQPFDGYPFNNKRELHKTEFFISYTMRWQLVP